VSESALFLPRFMFSMLILIKGFGYGCHLVSLLWSFCYAVFVVCIMSIAMSLFDYFFSKFCILCLHLLEH